MDTRCRVRALLKGMTTEVVEARPRRARMQLFVEVELTGDSFEVEAELSAWRAATDAHHLVDVEEVLGIYGGLAPLPDQSR